MDDLERVSNEELLAEARKTDAQKIATTTNEKTIELKKELNKYNNDNNNK